MKIAFDYEMNAERLLQVYPHRKAFLKHSELSGKKTINFKPTNNDQQEEIRKEKKIWVLNFLSLANPFSNKVFNLLTLY